MVSTTPKHTGLIEGVLPASATLVSCLLNCSKKGRLTRLQIPSMQYRKDNKDTLETFQDVRPLVVDNNSTTPDQILKLKFVGCLTSQQQASVSQGRICSDNFTCCYTAIEVADQTFHLTQSQYTDTGPASPSIDPITPGAWQCCHRSANF